MSYTGIENIPVRLRRRAIKILHESELWPLIQTILIKMGFEWVDITHGTGEHGRDLVGLSPTITGGKEIVAFIVKANPISGGVTGKTTLVTVIEQVKLALFVQYQGPNVRSPIKVNRVVVVTNKTMSDMAKKEISLIDIPYGSIEFWQIDDLEKKVTEYNPSFYLDIHPELYEYLIALRGECEHVRDIQRRVHYSEDKRLSDVFVAVRVMEVKRGKPRPITGKKKKKKDRSKIFGDIATPTIVGDSDLLMPKKDYVIVGGPGSGKSCLLRHTCIRLIENRLVGDSTSPIPLFLNTRDLDPIPSNIEVTYLLDKILCSSQYATVFGNSLREDSMYTLFVDGLDEIPSDTTRAKIYDFLLNLSSEYESLHIILSSRPLHMWRKGPSGDIQECTILPIQRSAMAELLEKLITRPEKSVSILKEITESELFQKIPQTPLVVTLLALLHEEEELPELPANLTDLYELFCMIYLERWTKNGQKYFDHKIAILELLAFELHSRRNTEMPVSDLLSITENYILKKGLMTSRKEFLTSLVKENLLLCCKGADDTYLKSDHCAIAAGNEYCSEKCIVGFIHMSFQEFFVARYLKRRPTESEEHLAQVFDDPWWGAIGMFFSGFAKDVPNLIQKVVASPSPGGPLSVTRMVNLGQLTQAAIQTDLSIRVISCLHGVSLIEDGYAYGIQLNEEYDAKMSSYQLVGSLCWLFEEAYSSYHLVPSLNDAFDKLLADFKDAEPSSEERSTHGLKLLALSWALADSGDIYPILELTNHIDESNGALNAFMIIVLESFEDYLSDKKRLPETALERRNEWLQSIKRIKKRARRYRDIIVQDMNKEASRISDE